MPLTSPAHMNCAGIQRLCRLLKQVKVYSLLFLVPPGSIAMRDAVLSHATLSFRGRALGVWMGNMREAGVGEGGGGWTSHLPAEDHLKDLLLGVAVEGRHAGQQNVQDDTQAPQVCLPRVLAPQHLPHTPVSPTASCSIYVCRCVDSSRQSRLGPEADMRPRVKRLNGRVNTSGAT